MTLPLPRLDRRSFPDLADEGRSLLPVEARGWTDHNASDPGITLLELLAAAADASSYRLDRTPAATRRAFLRLLGAAPRPRQVATTVLALELGPGGVPAVLPAGLEVTDRHGAVRFTTTREVGVLAARLVSVTTATGTDRIARPVGLAPARYPALGEDPAPGDALEFALDGPLSAPGGVVSLHVRAGADGEERELRRALADEAAADAAACGRPAPATRRHHDARTVWEYRTAAGHWVRATGIDDETRALTLGGAVRFTAPPAGGPAAAAVPAVLRCRLARGRYECPPRIAGVLLNAVPARHAAAVPAAPLGADDGGPPGGTGAAGQRVWLPDRDVVPGSSRLVVRLADGTAHPWTEVADWDRSGPHDTHYRLDHGTGEVAFGDERAGRVLPAGATVTIGYETGGGPSGNVAAGTLTRWAGAAGGAPGVVVRQPLPATGGAAPEALEDALGRALDLLAAPRRAVTLHDFEMLAATTPGAGIHRARAVAGLYPDLPGVPAEGCVTVVVVPCGPRDRPVPAPGLLRAVDRRLQRLRTVATEVHVTGPRFVSVSVRARVRTAVRGPAAGLAAAARAALDGYLHPLGGGPDRDGWPVGRKVYRAEIQELLMGVPGVVAVDGLHLALSDAGSDGAEAGACGCGGAEASCGNLAVPADALVTSGDHRLEVAERRTP